MGPLVTQQHRDKVASYLDSAAEQGATVVADGREHPLYGADGYFLGCRLIDNVTPGDGRVPRRDLRARAVGRARRVLRGGPAAHQRQPVRQRDGDLHPRRRGGPPVPVRRQRRHGRHQRPVPVPVAYYSFGGWKSSLFGDLHMYGPEGIQFYTRGKVVTSRWPDPGTSSVDLGFPRTR